jgi:hypothetical protein
MERRRPIGVERLVPIVYAELRRLAARKMSREREDHLLQPSALVNEAFVRLLGWGAARVGQPRAFFRRLGARDAAA